jgi:VanZ family protein
MTQKNNQTVMNSMDRIPPRMFLLLVSLLIVVLSHQPSLKPPVQWFPHQDKVFHLIEFGGLGFALVLNRDVFGNLRGRQRSFRMGLSGILWAVLDEYHQSFVPGRDCSIQDMMADVAGLFLGIWLFSLLLVKSTTSLDRAKESISQ